MKAKQFSINTNKGIKTVTGFFFSYTLEGYKVQMFAHRSTKHNKNWVITEKKTGRLVKGDGSQTRFLAMTQAVERLKQIGKTDTKKAILEHSVV